MTKIYVIETMGDSVCQCGFTMSKNVARQEAKELNKRWGNGREIYWVAEYTLNSPISYCNFD